MLSPEEHQSLSWDRTCREAYLFEWFMVSSMVGWGAGVEIWLDLDGE